MPFDFPNSPTVGQSVSGPNGATYVWDGVKWISGSVLGGGGIVALGATTPRILESRFADRYSVLDWLPAAQPDGVTDNSTQLQAAITAAAGKASLTFPAAAHLYIINTTLQVPSNSHLIIEAGATLRIGSGATALFLPEGTSNVLIDLCGTLDGNSTGSAGIVSQTPVGATSCSNVYVRGTRQGLIKNFLNWGVNLVACTNCEVSGVTVDSCGHSTEFAGITPWIGTSNTSNISSGVYTPATRALAITTTIAHGLNPGDAFTILSGAPLAGTGNYPGLAGSYVATAGTSGTTINTQTRTNVTAASLTAGIIKGPTRPCVNVGFSDCTIRNIKDLGCVLYGGVYGGFIRNCDISGCTSLGAAVFADNGQCGENRNCEIVDCVIHNNGDPAVLNFHPGVYVGGNATNVVHTDTVVSRNRIFGNNGPGIFANTVDRLSISDNILHENIYVSGAPAVPTLGISGEISLQSHATRVSVRNNTLYNPVQGCADGNGYGIAFDTSNYLVISGNRITDNSAGDNVTAVYMTAALGGNWGQYGLSSDNYYGPVLATMGSFPADQSVYYLASQQGPSYDAVRRVWCGSASVPGGPYLPLSGGTTSGPITVPAASGFVVGTAGPTIRSGAGAATGTQPAGSWWIRTDGSAGARIYVSQGGGTWNAVAGV